MATARSLSPSDVRRPPGPGRRIPAGNLLAFRRDPLGTLFSLARDHGDLVYMRLGPYDVYLASHPDDIKDVLVTSHRSFMKGQGLQEAKRLLGEGLLTSEGGFHQRQRRLIQPIFHHDRIDEYGAVMVEDTVRLRDRWRDGATVDMNAEMMRLTLTIVGRTLFDADVEGDAADVGRDLTTAIDMFDRTSLPWGRILERLPIPSTKRYNEARDRLFTLIERMIAERLAAAAAGAKPGGDLLSMLLAVKDEQDGTRMSDRQVRDEALTIFLAGHETTAQLLTWTWYLLSRNRRAEAILHAELADVLGDRLPSVADIPSLPYTEMVLSEVMRLYPPAYALGRRALQDHELRGYPIPAGSIVAMSQYVVHHDPRWFPEPFRFDPHRFTPEEQAKRPRYAYFPFGGGPRLCIGEGFAWMEAKLLLATLAQRWIALVDPSHAVELRPRVTLRPKGGLPVTLIAR